MSLGMEKGTVLVNRDSQVSVVYLRGEKSTKPMFFQFSGGSEGKCTLVDGFGLRHHTLDGSQLYLWPGNVEKVIGERRTGSDAWDATEPRQGIKNRNAPRIKAVKDLLKQVFVCEEEGQLCEISDNFNYYAAETYGRLGSLPLLKDDPRIVKSLAAHQKYVDKPKFGTEMRKRRLEKRSEAPATPSKRQAMTMQSFGTPFVQQQQVSTQPPSDQQQQPMQKQQAQTGTQVPVEDLTQDDEPRLPMKRESTEEPETPTHSNTMTSSAFTSPSPGAGFSTTVASPFPPHGFPTVYTPPAPAPAINQTTSNSKRAEYLRMKLEVKRDELELYRIENNLEP